jgi:glycosyltransferase involved in cell wall biosynthesis
MALIKDVEFPEIINYGQLVRSYQHDESRGLLWRMTKPFRLFAKWIWGISTSALILSLLLFIVINFYVFSSIVNLDSFVYIFFILSILTDGLLVLMHLPRREVEHRKQTFDPRKLSIVIASYNGEDVIAETIRQAMVHVPAKQIFVISDASIDRTVEIARNMGVRVAQNKRNMQKAFSISIAMRWIRTPYVLLLDDDTLIGNTKIPTSLLDDGYAAVAFNVMPEKQPSLINAFQRFEYRKSMQFGKNLRANAAAVGNISGAIGLYPTKDLIEQATLHSGQFAGEDEQRTLLTQINAKGKGVTFSDNTVITKAPETYLQLYRQRAYSWSLAVPELFVLYWRVILSPRYHYLLKSEKAYLLYVYLTDPLRMLFFWALLMRPTNLALMYGFYVGLNFLVWLKLGRKDPFRTILFFPIYSLGLTICRFIGHFYWLKVKAIYLAKRLYRYAERRHLLQEYAMVFCILAATWLVSTAHFASDLKLFNKIRSHRLEQETKDFNYVSTGGVGSLPALQPVAAPYGADYFDVAQEQGDTKRAIAYKAINQLLMDRRDLTLTETQRYQAIKLLTTKIPNLSAYQPGATVHIEKAVVEQAVQQGKQTS